MATHDPIKFDPELSNPTKLWALGLKKTVDALTKAAAVLQKLNAQRHEYRADTPER